MPKQIYQCQNCRDKFEKLNGRQATTEEEEDNIVYEASYSMGNEKEEKEASTCPRCKTSGCDVAWHWQRFNFYFKGNGIVRDINGARRDMNVYKLTQEDPYAEYRTPGEVEDIKAKLQKTGDYRKGKRSHTDMKVAPKITEKDVEKVTSNRKDKKKKTP